MKVNGPRLWQRLEQLRAVGADPRGGISRPAFGPEHAEAARMVHGWMREAGLEAGVDSTGNLIGLLKAGEGAVYPALSRPGRPAGSQGSLRSEPAAIGLGSHLDTVPQGGAFDGALGVLAALEVAQTLAESERRLRHPLAVIGFADEEGNNFGIGCLSAQLFTGEIPPERFAAIQSKNGLTLRSAIDKYAGAELPVMERPQLAAYLELHIEQGPILAAEGRPAAAVEAIVGISRTTVRFRGEANHAGTTPMRMRRDALWGSAELALFIKELGLSTRGKAVTTVGSFDVRPGATNVIPGEVELRIEMRTADENLMERLRGRVEERAPELAARYGLEVTLDAWHHAPATPMHPDVVAAARAALKDAGLEDFTMPSWAGHDAKILARHVPTGMLFVPSLGGWSHSPLEDTTRESCELGAQVMLHATLRLDESNRL